MHFNTINTAILDLSERAIRANKALRGRSGVLSACQSGRKTAEAETYDEAMSRQAG